MIYQQPSQHETLGAAAAGIAHDLNNQLTLIVNHLSFQNSQGPNLSPHDIASAMVAVDRCSALTACLLAAGRGEGLQLSPLDPTEFLRDFTAGLRLPEGVRLFLNIPTALPAIAANAVAVSRALYNLISNACAAMQNNGIVRISASKQSIEIADSGPGIPPEFSQRVFEPFFTSRLLTSQAATHDNQCTGLGLSIVREIMNQHSGSVTLNSEPGRGARFTLRFRPAKVVTLEKLPATQGRILKGSPRKIAPAA